MPFAIPLAALLSVLPCFQAPAGTAPAAAAAVSPLVGDDVSAVGHVDLAKADVPAIVRRLLGKLADEEDLRGAVAMVGGWTDSLKKAGAKDLFVLLDLADMPGLPVVAVPLAPGADAGAIAEVLSGAGARGFVRWPAAETIGGAVVAGTPAALARIRDARPAPRPGLTDSLGAGGVAAVKVAIILGATQRRAIEETMTTLPAELGGAPVTTLTRGLRWGTIAIRFDPTPEFRVVAKAEDAKAAESVRKLFADALHLLAEQCRKTPDLASLAPAISRLNPVAREDQVTFEAQLDDATTLVSVPIRQAREGARRTQCINHLKEIGLAMHNYHGGHQTFPSAFTASKEGKPLLSWRVKILPYLEQQDLYNAFHHDEPWDSPHNKTLISRMPETYVCPSGARALQREGKTSYLTPRGPKTIFPGSTGVKLKEITDGTSNTIMVVDAGDAAAVIWTKPDDWEVTPEVKTDGIFGHHPRGTNFLFGDGSVRFLREALKLETLKALITRNGGEVIGSDDY